LPEHARRFGLAMQDADLAHKMAPHIGFCRTNFTVS
jgi:hypothetical protein